MNSSIGPGPWSSPAEITAAWEQVVMGLRTGKRLAIVIGSGVSAGVGAPTMPVIHTYLQNKVSGLPDSETKTVVTDLLRLLAAEKQTPRSVQVRLYHLLQTSDDSSIRQLWDDFGVDLMSGQITGREPMWDLRTSRAHRWAAALAIQDHAVLISLNYDGLTKKAVEDAALARNPKITGVRKIARILSSPEEIRQFFANDERGLPDGGATDIDPVPVIKFRGDVFHAVCENGRCPEKGKQVPIYALLETERTASADGAKPKIAASAEIARGHLLCTSCGCIRHLQISFPGVFGKEQSIDKAVAAFHETFGTRLAGVLFIGFSGVWDESLVEYLVARCSALRIPIISASREPTTAIAQAAENAHVTYAAIEYNSRPDGDESDLHDLIRSLSGTSRVPSESPTGELRFPLTACSFPQGTRNELRFQFGAPGQRRTLLLHHRDGADSFTGVGGSAMSTDEFRRLQSCSQLGLKSAFLKEGEDNRHNRYAHSASAALLAMLWYEALLQQSPKRTPSWAWSEEGRLALEMAVMFHDARHLPFSHMMEEVFRELNWGYEPSASAPEVMRYVREIVPKFEKFPDLGHRLTELNVDLAQPEKWWSRVTAIQDGISGIPWLEAIADSAIDADKIEYIFNDTRLTGQNVRLPPDLTQWFDVFVTGQSVTAEGLIRLEGPSAVAAIDLLGERMELYKRLYLAPELRAFECVARYIVLTWLKWKVPDALPLMKTHRYQSEESLRAKKAEIGGELLWNLYSGNGRKHITEIDGLETMKEELVASSHIDQAAKDWLGQLWRRLEPFAKKPAKDEKASMDLATTEFAKMAPIGPLYVHERHAAHIRKIVRLWRVHYPLVALVDVAKFPTFLATPSNKGRKIGGSEVFTEQFLVPGRRPSEWRTRRKATTPLHQCDFDSFKLPALQLVIVDPWGTGSGGAAFLHEMLRREFQRHGIEWCESPEQVK